MIRRDGDGVARVGGMDGCAGGWVLVTVPAHGHGVSDVRVVPDPRPVLDMIDAGELAAVGIDIPIGLSESGPRRCDLEARRRLGPRASSVFPAPVRAVLKATTYDEACALSERACGKRLSMQLYNILAKIAAVDSLMTAQLQDKVFEVHPELSFSAMAGRPMEHYKRTPQGRDERVALLSREFSDVDLGLAARPARCAVDDVLDAYAVAWTAKRWLSGTGARLGGHRDSRGLRMEIVS